MINSVLTSCKTPGINYYLKKKGKKQLDITNIETSDLPDEFKNGENTVRFESINWLFNIVCIG